jgi:hypothetical protein
MVINQINVCGLAVLKAENHPPVAGNGDGVKSGHVAFKLVKLQAGNVHVLNREGRFKQSENIPQPLYKGLLHPLWLVMIIEGG